MKTKLNIFYVRFLCAIVILSHVINLNGFDGVETDSSESNELQWQQFRDEIVNDINKQRTAYNEDLRILKQQNHGYLTEVQSFSDVIQDMVLQISELNNKISQLETQNTILKEELGSRVNQVKTLIEDESNARKKADQDVIKEISNELAGVVGRNHDLPQPQNPSDTDKQSLRLYEVSKGDTLGAIATAFNIPINHLKSLNDLKTDLIVVGQRLKIPKN